MTTTTTRYTFEDRTFSGLWHRVWPCPTFATREEAEAVLTAEKRSGEFLSDHARVVVC